MTEAEWFATSRPLALFDSTPIPLSVRQQRLIALAACRLIPVALLGDRAEAWLKAAEQLSERRDVKFGSAQMRGRLHSAWRSQLHSHPQGENAHAALRLLLRADARPTIVNVGLARGAFDLQTYDGVDLELTEVIRDILGNPFRPAVFAQEWQTSTAVALAKGMYESHDFSTMPILADALQDAGCNNNDVLNHCRCERARHVRGCWVLDLVLGKV